MNLFLEEQEISICALRDEKIATIYCSDSTWITKMDKLVAKSPELFKVVAFNCSKTYEFPKRLISIRSSIRELSDEQRQNAGERMRKYQADKKSSHNAQLTL